LNSPTVQTFKIQNISKAELVLELSSSIPEEIRIFEKGALITSDALDNVSQAARKEKILESIGDRRSGKRNITLDNNNSVTSNPPSDSLSNVTVPVSKSPNISEKTIATSEDNLIDESSPSKYLDLGIALFKSIINAYLHVSITSKTH
jgi:hypothetical protein